MVDGESQEIVSEPAGGAPPNRDKRPEGVVIEGEAAPAEAARGGKAASAAEAESASRPEADSPPPPKAKPPGAGRALAAGAIGGAIVAALAAAGFSLFPLKANLSDADESRLAAMETAANRDDAAITGLDKRVGALEGVHAAPAIAALEKRVGSLEASPAAAGVAQLDKRLGALEAANAAEGPKLEAASHTVQALSGDIKILRADIDAARGEVPALTARVAKLETGASSADLSALAGRVDKVESALSAPKAETRVAPEKPKANDNPAAVAIVAEAVRDKLGSGAPFATELSALTALGVDPAPLAPLKALAGGAPTNRALAASFETIEPNIFAAVAPTEAGSVGERLLAHLRGLVQVRHLGEAGGDDPQALASQILANLQRGDLDGALAAFARLPEPARQAASVFAAEAGGKRDAAAAAQAIREGAVARLAESAKP